MIQQFNKFTQQSSKMVSNMLINLIEYSYVVIHEGRHMEDVLV